jgi:dipeptidyl aminopeptidase/acylaminoacyl peptidase
MHHRYLFVVLCRLCALFCLCALPDAPVAAKPAVSLPAFDLHDFIRLQRISEVAVAPDGKHVSVTIRSDDLARNQSPTAIWVIDTAKRAGSPQRLSGEASHDSSASWSADGKFLYFLSARSGSTQVWRIGLTGSAAPAGADALQITDLPLDVESFRIAASADRLLVSVAAFPDCDDLTCTRRRLEASAHQPASGVLYEHLFVRHWDSWNDGRRSQLFSIALDAHGLARAQPVNLTAGIDGDVPSKPFGGREDYAFSPDGKRVAFAVRIAGASEPWSTNFDIYIVDAGGGTPQNLTAENLAWDAQPAFSPDGTQLAYLATERPGFEADRFHLVVLNLASGVKRHLTEHWDRSIDHIAWSRDGKTLFATAEHLGQRPLWAIDASTGRSAAITGAGSVESYAVGADRIYYTASTLASPAELFAIAFNGGRAQPLTQLNLAVLSQRRLGDYEQFSFAGWNGEMVYGYVVKPPNLKPGEHAPLALLVHGGPEASLANEWHWRWNAESFAGAGYGVVLIDFHGSTGYGQAFTDSIRGDWGGKPLQDLALGLDAALKQFTWLDGGRACALGASYGGYMMNWIAGQWPDRFKCLVNHDGVFDLRSMYYSTEELWFPEWDIGGPEFANPAAYAKFNPVEFVQNWKTPTLVIHGQFDYRLPLEQGLATFTALQRRAIPSEFLYFPDENHWVTKPADRVQWYESVTAWLNRWTKP